MAPTPKAPSSRFVGITPPRVPALGAQPDAPPGEWEELSEESDSDGSPMNFHELFPDPQPLRENALGIDEQEEGDVGVGEIPAPPYLAVEEGEVGVGADVIAILAPPHLAAQEEGEVGVGADVIAIPAPPHIAAQEEGEVGVGADVIAIPAPPHIAAQEEGEVGVGEGEEGEEYEYTPWFNSEIFLVPEDDETEKTPWVSDSDEEPDQFQEDFTPIRSLYDLERIRDNPKKYRHCAYYILARYCFGDVREIVHMIRELSGQRDWRWVGNFDLICEAYSLMNGLGLLRRQLDKVKKILKQRRFNRDMVTSLRNSLPRLADDSNLQPPNVRYTVKAITTAVEGIVDALPLPPEAPVNGIMITNEMIDYQMLEILVEDVFERLELIMDELVQYPSDILPPEVLPPLPGPAPLPFPSPDRSPEV